jgi:ATP synthase F1 delta subunit
MLVDIKETMIARKYAEAYLNLYADSISLEDFFALQSIESFLAKHESVLFFLSLSYILPSIKRDYLDKLRIRFGVPESFNQLTRVLIEQKRGFLLDAILRQVDTSYRRRKKILFFTISSSPALTSEQIKNIQGFLAHMTGCVIMYKYTVDKTLIAGIRLQADTVLWEYSIRKQLDRLSQQQAQGM